MLIDGCSAYQSPERFSQSHLELLSSVVHHAAHVSASGDSYGHMAC